MNKFNLKKYGIIIALAIIASLVFIRTDTKENVPFCVNAAGCSAETELRGKVSTTTYGYPAIYKQTTTFNPANTNTESGGYAGYAKATVTPTKFNLLNLLMNVVFWFALLHLLGKLIKQRAKKAATADSQSAAASDDQPRPTSSQTPPQV